MSRDDAPNFIPLFFDESCFTCKNYKEEPFFVALTKSVKTSKCCIKHRIFFESIDGYFAEYRKCDDWGKK